MEKTAPPLFTGYQKFVVALLAILQFSIVLDFMILSPLGEILMRDLGMHPDQFGTVVSAYAISAGISGFLAAGFADRFDRKKWLLFFYSGFILGTVLCALAPDYKFLFGARIVTGVFGGVINSISFAIITDIFAFQMRGRVMGVVQTAFSASQVMGIPVGLFLATHLNWHAPFYMIAGVSVLVWVGILLWLKPITAHINEAKTRHPFAQLFQVAKNPRYLVGFSATLLLATGGFMLMPFGSAFSVRNLGISLVVLPIVYMVTGVSTMISGPFIGRWADTIGKYRVFVLGSILSIIMVLFYTQLGLTPLLGVIGVNVVLFLGITSRMVSAQALISGIPEPKDRGAFMSINSSFQQLSGGVAAWVAGQIVIQNAAGALERYHVLGWVVSVSMLIAIGLMFNVHRVVQKSSH